MVEYVIDASVAIKWVVKGEPFRNVARQLLHDARSQGIRLIGPPLLEYEVESILQRYWYHRRATNAAVNAALDALYAVRLQIVSHPALVQHAREIARQFDQERVYDSVYAALAELRSCDFWTADRAFYDAVSPDLSFVKYLPDYAGPL